MNSDLVVKARGSTVASSGCVVFERKCCGKKEPVAKPPTSQAVCLKSLSGGFSVYPLPVTIGVTNTTGIQHFFLFRKWR